MQIPPTISPCMYRVPVLGVYHSNIVRTDAVDDDDSDNDDLSICTDAV